MACDLRTKYLGLELAHPFIVAASSLTASLEGVQKSYANGASAVVLKSLFEEQIASETGIQEANLDAQSHPEALDYVRQMGMRLGPNEYLALIQDAKKTVPIPVIASINCVGTGWWTEYAKQIEAAGADALELNIGLLPQDSRLTAAHVEEQMYRIVDKVRNAVRLPLAVKLGQSYTNLAQVSSELFRLGVQGFVLFNRFYQLDVSLESMTPKAGVAFSDPHEYSDSLRWISLLYGRNSADYCASSGVHDSQTALKLVSVGASAVQLCSTLYRHGYPQITKIVTETQAWMDSKGYTSLGDIKGKVSQKKSENPQTYERIQYIKALTGIY